MDGSTKDIEQEKDVIAVKKPLFKLGQVVATPSVLESLEQSGQSVWEFLALHASGNWGVVDAEDAEANNEAIKDGSRLLSAYLLKDGKTKIWCITEAEDDHANRAATTLLLPDEY
jgi:hypothetical protein